MLTCKAPCVRYGQKSARISPTCRRYRNKLPLGISSTYSIDEVSRFRGFNLGFEVLVAFFAQFLEVLPVAVLRGRLEESEVEIAVSVANIEIREESDCVVQIFVRDHRFIVDVENCALRHFFYHLEDIRLRDFTGRRDEVLRGQKTLRILENWEDKDHFHYKYVFVFQMFIH